MQGLRPLICDSCRSCRCSIALYPIQMQGLRLPICDICISSRGSLASTVTAGEVAEAQARKLRQQLELQVRRGRNCQTTGGRIVRKHRKYRATGRCCQEVSTLPEPGAQHLCCSGCLHNNVVIIPPLPRPLPPKCKSRIGSSSLQTRK